MTTQNTITVGSAEVKRKHAIILIVMIIISLFPFPLSSLGADSAPYFLALPWWYWTAMGILVVVYLMSLYIVRDLQRAEDESTGGTDTAAEPVGGE